MTYWDWFLYLKSLCPDHFSHDQWEHFMLRETNALYRDGKITIEQYGRILNQVCEWLSVDNMHGLLYRSP